MDKQDKIIRKIRSFMFSMGILTSIGLGVYAPSLVKSISVKILKDYELYQSQKETSISIKRSGYYSISLSNEMVNN